MASKAGLARACRAGALALTAVAGSALAADPRPAGGAIFTCLDNQGRKITADRPIAACMDREQRVLNPDGSLRTVLPPTLTGEERAAKEARERQEAEARAAKEDAARRDRNLKARYPNEDSHSRAREAALEHVRKTIRLSEERLKELAAERKPLQDETEFYVGKPLPAKLRQQIDANDAATEAQRNSMANQGAELVRINHLYDVELERLKKLWAGAAPGSLGPLEAASAPTTADSR